MVKRDLGQAIVQATLALSLNSLIGKKLLHKEGETLVAAEITPWAMANGWKTKDADLLGKLAEKIGQGGRVVVRNKNQWRVDIISQLKSLAKQS